MRMPCALICRPLLLEFILNSTRKGTVLVQVRFGPIFFVYLCVFSFRRTWQVVVPVFLSVVSLVVSTIQATIDYHRNPSAWTCKSEARVSRSRNVVFSFTLRGKWKTEIIPQIWATLQFLSRLYHSAFLLFFQLLIFPSQCLRAVGDSKESTTFAGSLCCRLLASALIGTCTFQLMLFWDLI